MFQLKGRIWDAVKAPRKKPARPVLTVKPPAPPTRGPIPVLPPANTGSGELLRIPGVFDPLNQLPPGMIPPDYAHGGPTLVPGGEQHVGQLRTRNTNPPPLSIVPATSANPYGSGGSTERSNATPIGGTEAERIQRENAAMEARLKARQGTEKPPKADRGLQNVHGTYPYNVQGHGPTEKFQHENLHDQLMEIRENSPDLFYRGAALRAKPLPNQHWDSGEEIGLEELYLGGYHPPPTATEQRNTLAEQRRLYEEQLRQLHAQQQLARPDLFGAPGTPWRDPTRQTAPRGGGSTRGGSNWGGYGPAPTNPAAPTFIPIGPAPTLGAPVGQPKAPRAVKPPSTRKKATKMVSLVALKAALAQAAKADVAYSATGPTPGYFPPRTGFGGGMEGDPWTQIAAEAALRRRALGLPDEVRDPSPPNAHGMYGSDQDPWPYIQEVARYQQYLADEAALSRLPGMHGADPTTLTQQQRDQLGRAFIDTTPHQWTDYGMIGSVPPQAGYLGAGTGHGGTLPQATQPGLGGGFSGGHITPNTQTGIAGPGTGGIGSSLGGGASYPGTGPPPPGSLGGGGLGAGTGHGGTLPQATVPGLGAGLGPPTPPVQNVYAPGGPYSTDASYAPGQAPRAKVMAMPVKRMLRQLGMG